MALEILMPAAAAGAEHATLLRWLKQEGEPVRKGEALAEVETDKAIMEISAEADGRLAQCLVKPGTEGVKVGAVIAVLAGEGEVLVRPAAAPAPAAKPPVAAEVEPDRIASSPSARRLAREKGVDIAALQGSGPRGRIVRLDVERAAPSVRATPAASARFETIPHTGMRRTIARRLTEAKQQIPHYYLNVECRMDALLGVRERINARAVKTPAPVTLSVNDLVVYAVARCLRRVPEINASWTDEAIQRWTEVDVSVAVATPGGLITPIVRNADRKTLSELSQELQALSAKAKAGQLSPSEYQGGGFTVSNLGMYGIHSFSAVINPPQAAILAVGAAEKRPVIEGDRVVPGTLACMTLSADHRVIDGALGARFLQELRALIEDPALLLA